MNCPIETVRAKIIEFQSLEKGWHFGEGVQTQPVAFSTALQILDQLELKKTSKANAFPGLAGEVRITVYEGSHYYEFTVEIDETVAFIYELGEQEMMNREGLSLKESINLFSEVYTNAN